MNTLSNQNFFSISSVLFLIIGLVIGIGIEYFIISHSSEAKIHEQEIQINSFKSEISILNQQINNLQTNIDDLQSQIGHEQADISNLESEISNLKTTYEGLQDILEKCEEINKSYTTLLNTLNMTIIQNFSQSIEYNISAGTERTWEFLIPKYGIIWEAKISFSGIYVSMSHAWRLGENRVFVGSSGISLTYKGSADIFYYGIQEYLWGTISVDYYLDDRNPNKIWVTSNIMSNLSTINREGSAYIDI